MTEIPKTTSEWLARLDEHTVLSVGESDALCKHLESLRDTCHTHQVHLSTAEEEGAAVQRQLEAEKEESDRLQQELNEAQRDNQDLLDANHRLRDDLTEEGTKLEAARAERRELQQKVDDLTAQLQELQ